MELNETKAIAGVPTTGSHYNNGQYTMGIEPQYNLSADS